MPSHQKTKSYNPRGILKDEPIYLRLSADELQQLKSIASRENRSLAAMSRLLVNEGLRGREQFTQG